MDSQRWLHLSRLFDAVLDLPAAQRERYIEERCAGDAALADELRRMLTADEQAASREFLDAPIVVTDAQLWLDAESDDYPAGSRRFGPYRLLRLIGRGGMGEVHLAERDDGQFEQRVALKLLPHPTPGLIQRFRRERQIVARLEHPHIARLLDGGVGDANIPYFAMEFVDGLPITRFVTENRLDLPATLRLFLGVCDAVAYAHRNLVVHRDIKPSNILVGADGTPKLLDFGIAKVLQTDSDAPTKTLARAFTPDYAAPEQIRGETMTTAVDIYALGVVLYELLTGARPYKLKRDQALEQAILSIEPVAPSHALERNDEAGTSERKRALRGDLDRIVLHALAKEPGRRYATIEAFAEDIRRWLDGRPVLVRGDNAWYRARKFVGRHAFACAFGAAAALLLIAATAFSLRQARIANAEATRAEQKSKTAEAVKDYLLSVFASANPYNTDGKVVTARDLLEGGLDQVDKKLAGQTQVQAEIYADFAETFKTLDQMDLGKRAGERALAAYAQYLPADALEVLRVQCTLAEIDFELARFNGLIARFDDLLARIGDRGGDYAGVRSDVLMLKQETLYRMGDLDASLTAGEYALAEVAHARGEKSYEASIALYNLALVRIAQGRVMDAAALIDRFVAIDRSRVGPEHPGLMTDVSAIARVLYSAGRLREARELWAGALAARRRNFAENHGWVVRMRGNLADADRELGDAAASEAVDAELVGLVGASSNFPAYDLAVILIDHAHALIALGRLAEARSALDKADERARLTAADGTLIPLMIGAMRADIERREGRPADALAKLANIIQRQRKHDDRELPASLLAQARASVAGGQPVDAAKALTEARDALARQGRPFSTVAREVEEAWAALPASILPRPASAEHWQRAAQIGCVNFGCEDGRVKQWERLAAQNGAPAGAGNDKPFEAQYALAVDILAKANASAHVAKP